MEEFKKPENSRDNYLKEVDSYLENYHKLYDDKDVFGFTKNTNRAETLWRSLFSLPEYGEKLEIKKILKSKLEGKNFIDLGAGNLKNLLQKEQISFLGLKKYIACNEKNSDFQDNNDSSTLMELRDSGIDASYVADDILHFTSRLPDGSSNFLMSAIDDAVLRENKYWEYLSKELTRTTEKKGIIMDVNSDIRYFLPKEDFKAIYQENEEENWHRGGLVVFEKIK